MKMLSTAAALVLAMTVVRVWAGEEAGPVRPVIVVDNGGAGFSSQGRWNPSTRDPGFVGKGYLWHAKGEGEGTATWRAAVPKPGQYNVYARWVMSKPTDRATNAPFTIKTVKGYAMVRVDMAQSQSAAEFPRGRVSSPWNLLGTFSFAQEAAVVLSNDANNSVVADAVRFEYMEPLDAPAPRRGKLLFKDDCDAMDNWFIEGSEGKGEMVNGVLHVTSTSRRKGVHAWFRPDLPDHVRIEYDMTVHGKSGFALVFFCAKGTQGEDIIKDLPPRDGAFSQYVRNDRLRCYHLSVHRFGTRSWVQGANLNKNPPKTLLQRNAVDPCPPAEGDQTYHMVLIKAGPRIQLLVNDKLVLFYLDDGGKAYNGGKFGFRQIYGSSISYDNLRVYEAAIPGE